MLRTTLLLLVLLLSAASSAQAQVTIPNTFTDGTPALASEVNANFEALASAVSASECATPADVVCNPNVSCPAAPACDTLGAYDQGHADGVGSLDVAAATAAAFASGVASVDITTDNHAAEVSAGQEACLEAGGSWGLEAGKWRCTPPPPPPYNCFVGNFCYQLALNWNPAGPTIYDFPAYRGCATLSCLRSDLLLNCEGCTATSCHSNIAAYWGAIFYGDMSRDNWAVFWDDYTVSQILHMATLFCQSGGASTPRPPFVN